MKQFLIVTWWEFLRHFKSRSFILSTFVSPIIFGVVVFVTNFYIQDSSIEELRFVGCVEFDTSGVCQNLQQRLTEISIASGTLPVIDLITVTPDTSSPIKKRFEEVAQLKAELDSLEDTYNIIKERRKYIFQKPKSQDRERSLKSSYENLIQTREARDLMQIEYQKTKSETDSLWQIEIIRQADEKLVSMELEGYLLVKPDDFSEGIVEFHSLLPVNFLEIEQLKQATQVVIVEQRLKRENLRVDKIQEWLQPIVFREIQLQGEDKKEIDFLVNYLGPIIVVLFLFISIFTSSGFLFSGVLKEKTNRVIELLLSAVNHTQLVAGKILGLGILGIFQIIIWFGLTLLLIGFDLFDTSEINFLTLKNAGLFLLYFVLGYLYFASIFVGIGSLFSNEEDAHHLSQFMRMLSIIPILLAILVLKTPNSLLVRILSFIPPLTPTFMILRTPLGNPPPDDYLISTGIMVASIILSIFFAGKLFKIGSLMYGKRVNLKEILSIMFRRKRKLPENLTEEKT
jgi:ABC-2 type transport system permease protein